MNCLPVGKRIRRILRKMFQSSRMSSKGYEKLCCEHDKENRQPDFNYCPSLSSSPGSSSNFHSSSIRDANNNNLTYVVQKTYLNSNNDVSDRVSSFSSGYESWKSPSPPPPPFKVHEDQLSRSFDSLLQPFQSYSAQYSDSSSGSSSPMSNDYSPLSSFQFADATNMPSAFFSDFDIDLPQQHSENLAHDDVRRDFDMNGRTMEVHENFFVPSASSTPMIHRRMTQIHYQTASYQQQSPPHMMQYQPQQRFMQPPEFKRKMLPPKKKFKPNKKSLEDHCVFCKNNGAEEKIYRSHTVKDALGRVLCPTLRLYKCPICGEDGDKSHTVKYCPKKPIVTLDDIQQNIF